MAAGDLTLKEFIALGRRSPKPNVTVTGDDIALLQYTGGTTGLSKGAIGLHRNLVANALMVSKWITDWNYGQDSLLGAIPFFHSYGMVTAVIFTLAIGGRIAIVPNPVSYTHLTLKEFIALGRRSPKPSVTVTGDDIALLQYLSLIHISEPTRPY